MNCLLPMWQFCDLELTVNRLTRFSEYHYKASSNGFGMRVKTESHKGDIICPHCPRYLLCIIWQSVPKHHPWHESHTGSECEARQSALDGLGSPQRLSCAVTLNSFRVCGHSPSNLPVGLGKVTGDKPKSLCLGTTALLLLWKEQLSQKFRLTEQNFGRQNRKLPKEVYSQIKANSRSYLKSHYNYWDKLQVAP